MAEYDPSSPPKVQQTPISNSPVYTFPPIHSFPPFYTKQSNATILQNQLEEWCKLILQYCQAYGVYSVLPSGAILKQQNEGVIPPFFENPAIERAVAADFKKEILHHLVHKLGRGCYISSKTSDAGVLVYWRTLSEWAELLYAYIETTGQQGAVLTVYELTRSEESAAGADFLNIDSLLFEKILDELRKQGRASVIREDGEIGGVKFN